jgi:beta-lactamase regulating signal transducer with metallopeptidase domain
MTVLIGIALKSLLIAGLTLGLLELMKRRSAAERSWIAHAGLFALVLMAVAPVALPYWTVEGPSMLGTTPSAQAPTQTAPARFPTTKDGKLDVTALALSTVDPKAVAPQPAAAKPSSLSATAATMVLYAIPAAMLLFITFLALARLVTLRARADVLVDGHWLSALARAQRRMGFKHGTALLTSDELASPISWGLMRPVIVLNTRAVEAQGEAEAIIAHELAHVARMDWIKLLLARIATALFWFNPLVWLLAREAHQLREETADDAVLAADISDTDYATLLVGVARHECPGLLLGAHGVAPSRNSLSRRVARVLDGKIMRGPVAGSFAAGVFVGAVVIAAPLAALTLVPSGTSAAKKAAAAAPAKKAVAYAPYYPETAPTDLPSIISQGVSTSVESAVAAISPTISRATNGDYQAVSPSGASVTTHNGITTATASSGATTMVYPPDAHGRRKVVMRGPNGATMVTYADSDDDIPGAVSAPFREKNNALQNAIAMKAVGVTPEYVAAIRASSRELRDADMDDMMGMKAVGVTPAYVHELAEAGLRNFDASDVAGARAVGVDGNFIREMRAVGFGDADLSDLTGARAVGISGSYIRQMRLAGYDGDLGDFIALRSLSGSKRIRPTMPPIPPAPPRLPSH